MERRGGFGRGSGRGAPDGLKRKRNDIGHHALPEVPKVMSSVLLKLQKEYIEKFQQLIKFELEAENELILDRLQKYPTQRLIREGLVLFDLQASVAGNLFSETLIKVKSNDSDLLPHHRFKQGDSVTLCRKHPTQDQFVMEGVVAEKYKMHLIVTIDRNLVPADLTKGTWRMDQGVNKVSYERMREALETFCSNKNSVVHNGTMLRDIIVGKVKREQLDEWAAQPPSFLIATPPTPAANTSTVARTAPAAPPEPPQLKITPEQFAQALAEIERGVLNDTQKQVIREAMGRRLALVQGPPGTGKTHTAVFILRLWAKLFPDQCVMVTADTNTAVDNLLEGLVTANVPCLRIGRPVKVREELRDRTLDGRMYQHPLMSEVQRLREQFTDSAAASASKANQKGLKEITRMIRDLEHRMVTEILSTTRVMCATCIGAAHDLLADRNFPLVLIDGKPNALLCYLDTDRAFLESTQATEPASLCPIVKGSQQLILLGDHYQLPPTVVSPKAEKGGLACSLFQRLVNEGVKPFLLDVQYRMHPMISAFPSAEFYEGRLRDGIDASVRPVPKGFNWPVPDCPVVFIDVHSVESKSEEIASRSKSNSREAQLALDLLEDFVQGGDLTSKDIAIITPYNGQVKLLNDMFLQRKLKGVPKITVSSVDGFQGREKELIIFSAVRANSEGKVGFLSDWKRLNVGLTRARRGLLVLGHRATLVHDPHWKRWVEWMVSRGLILELRNPEAENAAPPSVASKVASQIPRQQDRSPNRQQKPSQQQNRSPSRQQPRSPQSPNAKQSRSRSPSPVSLGKRRNVVLDRRDKPWMKPTTPQAFLRHHRLAELSDEAILELLAPLNPIPDSLWVINGDMGFVSFPDEQALSAACKSQITSSKIGGAIAVVRSRNWLSSQTT